MWPASGGEALDAQHAAAAQPRTFLVTEPTAREPAGVGQGSSSSSTGARGAGGRARFNVPPQAAELAVLQENQDRTHQKVQQLVHQLRGFDTRLQRAEQRLGQHEQLLPQRRRQEQQQTAAAGASPLHGPGSTITQVDPGMLWGQQEAMQGMQQLQQAAAAKAPGSLPEQHMAMLDSIRGGRVYTLDVLSNESPATGVTVMNPQGECFLLKGMALDSGCTISLAGKAEAQRMGLPSEPCNISVKLADGRTERATELAVGGQLVFAAGTPYETYVPFALLVLEGWADDGVTMLVDKAVQHAVQLSICHAEQQLEYTAANGQRHRLPIRGHRPRGEAPLLGRGMAVAMKAEEQFSFELPSLSATSSSSSSSSSGSDTGSMVQLRSVIGALMYYKDSCPAAAATAMSIGGQLRAESRLRSLRQQGLAMQMPGGGSSSSSSVTGDDGASGSMDPQVGASESPSHLGMLPAEQLGQQQPQQPPKRQTELQQVQRGWAARGQAGCLAGAYWLCILLLLAWSGLDACLHVLPRVLAVCQAVACGLWPLCRDAACWSWLLLWLVGRWVTACMRGTLRGLAAFRASGRWLRQTAAYGGRLLLVVLWSILAPCIFALQLEGLPAWAAACTEQYLEYCWPEQSTGGGLAEWWQQQLQRHRPFRASRKRGPERKQPRREQQVGSRGATPTCRKVVRSLSTLLFIALVLLLTCSTGARASSDAVVGTQMLTGSLAAWELSRLQPRHFPVGPPGRA